MNNLIKDLSILTTVPEDTLTKLVDKCNWCICEYVNELQIDTKREDNIVEIDLGIGKLSILISDNQLKYKFIPSETLNTSIRNTIIKESNPLKNKLEQSIVNKITNTYKDLL